MDDPRKSDQVVRGATVLPNGTGKTVRVAVFAQGDKAAEASEAGADVVGMDDLAADVKAGNLDFDVVIATPDTMRIVGLLGQILGPRGLMPTPKAGTVTDDLATAVKDVKSQDVFVDPVKVKQFAFENCAVPPKLCLFYPGNPQICQYGCALLVS